MLVTVNPSFESGDSNGEESRQPPLVAEVDENSHSADLLTPLLRPPAEEMGVQVELKDVDEDLKENQYPASAEESAGFFSRLCFSWLSPLVWKARRDGKEGKPLEQSKVWGTRDEDENLELASQLQQLLEPRMSNKYALQLQKGMKDTTVLPDVEAGAALRGALLRLNKAPLIASGILALLGLVTQIATPIILKELLEYIETQSNTVEATRTTYVGYLLALGLVFTQFLQRLSNHHMGQISLRMRLRWQSAVTSLAYLQTLRLRCATRQEFAPDGKIVSYAVYDSNMLSWFGANVNSGWQALALVLSYICILWVYIGPWVLAGVAVLLLSSGVASFALRIVVQSWETISSMLDTRMGSMNEILQNVLGLKMGAWETFFIEKIKQLRVKEIQKIGRAVMAETVVTNMINVGPILSATAAIVSYTLLGDGVVNAPILFTTTTTFMQLKYAFETIPVVYMQWGRYKVATNRVGQFLSIGHSKFKTSNASKGDDLKKQSLRSSASFTSTISQTRALAIQIINGTFYWLEGSTGTQDSKETPALKDIDLNIQEQKLTVIVGPVGSGKSSLCSAILGELFRGDAAGSVYVKGRIAYCAQTAWMMNATLRDNILFGQPFDEARYRDVLKVCALVPDLQVLEHGDHTMIGEKGINLSGGQKQRISLARAAYSPHRIVLMDDPLSALDPKVAKSVFQDCIVDFMKSRTRVLVTNQLDTLDKSDWVVVMQQQSSSGAHETYSDETHSDEIATDVENFDTGTDVNQGSTVINQENEVNSDKDDKSVGTTGFIKYQSTFQDLKRNQRDFAEMIARYQASQNHSEEPKDGEHESAGSPDDIEERLTNILEKSAEHQKQGNNTLMQDEERAGGAVKFSTYRRYIAHAGGCPAISLFLFLIVFFQALVVFNSAWMTFWTDAEARDYTGPLHPFSDVLDAFGMNVTLPQGDREAGTVLYAAGIGVVAIVIGILGALPVVVSHLNALRASRNLHNKALISVLHAPMSFFDTTPLGRILSRFSSDTLKLDSGIGHVSYMAIDTFCTLLASMITIGSVTYYFFVLLCPLALLYGFLLRVFRPLNRELQRLENVSYSPMVAHVGETLTGVTTIRAYGQNGRFRQVNADRVNVVIRNSFALGSANQWLGLRLTLLSTVVVFGAAILAVVAAVSGSISAGLAGLSLNLALSIAPLLSAGVLNFAQLESSMNSVDRMLHYTSNIEQEASFTSKKPPPNSWPESGTIQVCDLQMRYRKNTPLVLKGISFTIQAGDRVGVCGRTGSGKSSLLLCLMRLVEPAGGSIVVDGVDITSIGLKELRTKIGIVPQNPVVFEGTLRSNLAPAGKKFTDAQLWTALEHTGLKEFVASSKDKLDMVVNNSGSNLSQGQRQLLALTRSLLDGTKILLLDEATSSIDFDSDVLIQKALRDEDNFGGCTVVTIAHRINTIIDCDKILVLVHGEVCEYDSPSVLLSDPNSEFSQLAKSKSDE